MDVHRSRFVSHPVPPITAVAFSRSSDEKLPPSLPQPALRLAIGRGNGQIEIWNPIGGKWVQEVVLYGVSKNSVDGLVWTREPDEVAQGQMILGQHRLFSISSSPHVIEWDLQRGLPKKTSTGNFSEVWCFAAQPRQESSAKEEQASQNLVAGCGDGSIILLSTADDDLQFQRFLARVPGKKAKCMSITYQTRERVLAGFADSNIRIFDTRNGAIIRTMSLGNGIPPAPKSKFVWQVKCLPNGDIVSGDSSGDVVFWDGRSYSLTQRIKGHDSDCIDIVTSADGKAIFTGSLDGRIAVYHNVLNTSGRKSWAKIHHRRIHTKSEVKSMSAYDGDGLSVVVSGGDDLAPAVTPLREYGKENWRGLPHLPQQPPVTSARTARLLMSWSQQSISIWRIARQSTLDLCPEPTPPRRLVAKISLNTQQDIRHATISEDGKVLAVATGAEVKLFQLRRRADAEALSPRKLDVPRTISSSGARLLQFSPNGKWLAVVTVDNEIHIARLTADAEKPKYLQVLDRSVELERVHRGWTGSAFGLYEQTITRLAFARDGSMLAASDLSGHLDTWVLKGHEDPAAPAVDVTKKQTDSAHEDSSSDSSDDDDDDQLCVFHGQHWVVNPSGHLLPKLESAPLILTFRPPPTTAAPKDSPNGNPGTHPTRQNPHAHSDGLPQGDYRLWVMTAKHQMYEFDVLAGRLSDWSRHHPTAVLPEDFLNVKDRAMDAVWDVTERRQRIWLYGPSWLFMLTVGGGDVGSGPTPRKRRPSTGVAADVTMAKKLKTSGAGSRTVAAERDGLPARLIRTENGTVVDVDLDARHATKSGDEGDDGGDEDVDLRLTRVTDADGGGPGALTAAAPSRTWWCTFQYRPILGVVALADDANVEEDKPLEVVVVERPVWDILEEGASVKS